MSERSAARLWRVLVASASVLWAACHGAAPLPPAAGLLRRAAAETRSVRTVHFTLAIEGALGSFSVRRAEGALTREGDAEATITFDQGGSLVDYEVIATDDRFFLKGPTGGYQEIPAALVGAAFDPASLLDPEKGVAGILASATGGRTVEEEPINGTRAYRVDARIDVGALAEILPSGADRKALASSLWIGADRPLLLRVRAVVPGIGSRESSTVTVTLDHVNEPVGVTAPSV